VYREFFGFVRMPFSLSPDPSFYFASAKHQEGLASLLYVIQERKGFALVTGEVGAGKTLLCRSVLNELDVYTRSAYITTTALSDLELAQAVCGEFDIPNRGRTKWEMLEDFGQFVASETGKGRNIVIIIDEAQNLSLEALEEVRMLGNFESDEEKFVQVLLVGQPELRRRTLLPEMRQLTQRLAVKFHLYPLNRKETEQYIHHRLHVAGGNSSAERLFPSEVIDSIYDHSHGVPRIINLLCDQALLTCYVEEWQRVTPAVIDGVLQEMNSYYTGLEPGTSAETTEVQALPPTAPTGAPADSEGTLEPEPPGVDDSQEATGELPGEPGDDEPPVEDDQKALQLPLPDTEEEKGVVVLQEVDPDELTPEVPEPKAQQADTLEEVPPAEYGDADGEDLTTNGDAGAPPAESSAPLGGLPDEDGPESPVSAGESQRERTDGRAETLMVESSCDSVPASVEADTQGGRIVVPESWGDLDDLERLAEEAEEQPTDEPGPVEEDETGEAESESAKATVTEMKESAAELPSDAGATEADELPAPEVEERAASPDESGQAELPVASSELDVPESAPVETEVEPDGEMLQVAEDASLEAETERDREHRPEIAEPVLRTEETDGDADGLEQGALYLEGPAPEVAEATGRPGEEPLVTPEEEGITGLAELGQSPVLLADDEAESEPGVEGADSQAPASPAEPGGEPGVEDVQPEPSTIELDAETGPAPGKDAPSTGPEGPGEASEPADAGPGAEEEELLSVLEAPEADERQVSATGAALLRMLNGPEPGKEFVLGEVTTVGRAPGNDLVIADRKVSRRHAKLVARDRGYSVVDLGSSNGTYVNSTRVTEGVLRPGDLCNFATVTFEFCVRQPVVPDADQGRSEEDSTSESSRTIIEGC